jgi:hypothetical protein
MQAALPVVANGIEKIVLNVAVAKADSGLTLLVGSLSS